MEFDPLAGKTIAQGNGAITSEPEDIFKPRQMEIPLGEYQFVPEERPQIGGNLIDFGSPSETDSQKLNQGRSQGRSSYSGTIKLEVEQSPQKLTNYEPMKPSRPPPPPPPNALRKKRAGSENSLLDLDSTMVNLKLKPSASAKSFKQTSSFYVDSTPETNMRLPVTREPAALNSGGSSFYDVSMRETSESVSQKIFGHREQKMQLYMMKRQDEYTIRKPFKIFAGTWNVNGQIPPAEVKDWLYFDVDPPDIYFIGFQELDLSKEALVFSESTREDDWIKVVGLSLPNKVTRYKMLKHIRLVGMMLLVYAKWEHVPHIQDVAAHQVGTGILGRMGNKGGVSVRIEVHNSSICVVNSHLAAHMEQTRRRNEDFKDICSKLQFPIDSGQFLSGVHHHDIVFWLGDLNYRIEDLAPEYVKELIDQRDYKLLREKDQLLDQKSQGNVFQGFSEGEIQFRPTYKYNPGTDDWDSSDKCRMPAWCDRVLWWESALTQRNQAQVKPASSVELLKYRSHMKLKISDHKPVSALFNVKVKVIDEVKYKKVFEDENRRLDKLENEYLPTMTLDIQHVDFGDVKFQQPKQAKVELFNPGMIPCNFEFICRPGEDLFCKKWLTVTEPRGCLLPGEKFILDLEVYVNRFTAPLLNTGEEKLDDILILHLIGGKDFFITVNGRYLPSCFGSSIETLCRLRRPIRDVEHEEIKRLSKIEATRVAESENVQDGAMLAIPKELWALVDHLYLNARRQVDLFQQPGLHSELEEIRDCLDTRNDISSERIKLPGSNHSVAEAVLVLLESFPEPVIPYHIYEPCLEVCEIFHLCKQVLQGVSYHHRNVFKYIMAFLRELLKYNEDNGLEIPLLASIFSGLMLRPSPKKRIHRIEARLHREKATKFLTHFLRNEYDE